MRVGLVHLLGMPGDDEDFTCGESVGKDDDYRKSRGQVRGRRSVTPQILLVHHPLHLNAPFQVF